MRRKNFSRKSFRFQLTISYLVISILPVLLVLSVVFFNTLKGAREAVGQKLDSTVELIASQVNSLVDNMSFISISLISSTQVMSAAKGLGYPDKTLMKEQEYYSELKKEFCSYAIVDSPYNVTFFNQEGYYITSRDYNMAYNSRYRLPEEAFQDINWLDRVQDNYGRSVLLPVQENAMPLSGPLSLTLVRAVRDPGKNVGYLGVQVDRDQLDNIFSIGAQQGAEVLMLGASGEVIYATEGFPLEQYDGGEDGAAARLEAHFLTARNVHQENGITTILVYPKTRMLSEAGQGVTVLAVEACFLLSLTVVFIFRYADKLTRPLRSLTRQMQEITINDLEEDAGREPSRYEEIEYLYRGYAQMRRKLNVMLRNEIAGKTLQMQERLNSLQSQIHPHFLYNTLNVIGIMGLEGESGRVYDACFKLSNLLRYSIADKNKSMSTLREEMENSADYLELMKLRYEHRLTYEITCGEEVSEAEVPRLILQPFVENIFEHAYSGEHPAIHVEIHGTYRDHCYIVEIRDNGQGMEEDALERLKEEIRVCCTRVQLSENREDTYGIGIQNTILRLVLSFGERFSYSIEKGESGGIHVKLSIREL